MRLMSELAYRVMCQCLGCTNEAIYKVAAEWSDSTFNELKTYALACQAHLGALYADARVRCGNYTLAEGETLTAPGIFEFPPADLASTLVRRRELEEQLDSGAAD
jgi:hypothetical protein